MFDLHLSCVIMCSVIVETTVYCACLYLCEVLHELKEGISTI